MLPPYLTQPADYPDMEEEITPAVVTCGNSHTACITRRGMLYTWGLGNRGELGLVPLGGEVRAPCMRAQPLL